MFERVLQMTVEENLEMGAYTQPKSTVAPGLERVYEQFPRLKERRRQVAGTLSGGEQRTQSFASLAGGGGLVHNLFHHRFQGVGNLVGGGGGSQFPHQLNDAWLDDFAVVSSCAHA